jgi:ribosomal protein L32E
MKKWMKIGEKWMKLKNTTKLRTKLRGNGVLASLAYGKFEEEYEI